MIKQLILASFILCTACNTTKQKVKPQENSSTDSRINLVDGDIRIAFGSCSDEDKEQVLWDDVLAEQADVWVWLGDNIYGDSEDMNIMRAKYDKQKSHPLYQQLTQETTILGVWDDHDYGANDAGKEFAQKEGSQKEFLRFLDVHLKDDRWLRPGIYTSHDFIEKGVHIKFLLLDARYFRDLPIRKDKGYQPNETGSILGDDQWAWLEEEFKNSKADIHIIASGIQVIPVDHRFEKWNNFPNERKRLFSLIEQYNVSRPIIISGDRHIGEISKITVNEKEIYEITSSSLTHGWKQQRPEENRHRIGNIVYKENFGMISIDAKDMKIKGKLKSDGGEYEEGCNLH